jgi:hypothetical protein
MSAIAGDGRRVFPLLFDDFVGTALDGKWNVNTGDANITVTGGKLIVTTSYVLGDRRVYSKQSIGNNVVLRYGTYNSANGASAYIQIGWYDGSNYLICDWCSDSGGWCKLYSMGSLDSVSVGYDNGVYHAYDVGRPGTSTSLQRDSDAVRTLALGGAGSYPVNIRAVVANGPFIPTIVLDFITLRRYIASPPIAGTAAPTAANRSLCRSIGPADVIRACCGAA